MASAITPEQRASIQERTVVYNPIYVNGMKPADPKGAYILYYIFSDSPAALPIGSTSGCIVETLESLSKRVPLSKYTFVKIGNFGNGSKSRHSTNKGDLIKNDGNRSPAAKHTQDVLLSLPELYVHFIMVVLSPDTIEKNLEDSLKGIVTSIHNKPSAPAEKPKAGRWRVPQDLTTSRVKISEKLSTRILEKVIGK